MKLLGNLLFFVFGGIVLCLTIVGIPLGFQCFKLAGGVLAAFLALTIVGFPIAAQHIKLLPLALLPFGRKMRDIETGRIFWMKPARPKHG